jgi:DNA-binding winged helix-turn-helix (wHTH) protein
VTGRHLTFGAFVLDVEDACLRRGAENIDLRPRSCALLRYLAENPGRVVTKDELLQTVWAGTRVSDTVLKVCVREIREALGDAAKAPRFIETIPRQGYRFVAAVGTQLADAPAGDEDERFASIVGRARELAQLETWLAQAEQGQRKLVFVTGEPGVGKTTLVDLFLARSRVRERLRVGRGQCLERYGEGEAYLPVLEALGQLCSEPGGERLVAVLGQYAPTWLVQLPALVDDRELEAQQRRVAGSTRERMLREITEALEAYGSSVGLGLVLEDLQWSDYSTLELLAYLAHRRREVRLLVVATYRPAEVAQRQHPLAGIKQELHAHGQCEELVVERLGTADVSDYVARRLGAAAGPALGPVVHARTEGNALFMVNLVEYARTAGLVGTGEAAAALAAAVPETLRQMIGKQLGDLGDETRGLLEVASVAGVQFTAAGVAAGAQCAVETVERACDALGSQGQVLRKRAVVAWPDGTVSAGYAFAHGFYRQVLYEDMGDGQRARVHRAIGLRKEAAYGAQCDAIAGELALHFEYGHDYPRALRYTGPPRRSI